MSKQGHMTACLEDVRMFSMYSLVLRSNKIRTTFPAMPFSTWLDSSTLRPNENLKGEIEITTPILENLFTLSVSSYYLESPLFGFGTLLEAQMRKKEAAEHFPLLSSPFSNPIPLMKIFLACPHSAIHNTYLRTYYPFKLFDCEFLRKLQEKKNASRMEKARVLN